MTKSRYYIMSVWKLFSNSNRKILENATHEMHMLKTAQYLLGYYNYQFVEELDEVKTEYWKLRELNEKIQNLETEEREMQEGLNSIIEQRQDIPNQAVEVEELIDDKISELVISREELVTQRTEILNQGKTSRKKYDGLKAKLDYFMKSLAEDDPEKAEVESQLDKAVESLNSMRQKRDEIVKKINKVESDIHQLEEEAREIEKDKISAANLSFNNAGEQTKAISKLRGEKATYQVEVDKHIRYIGRFLFKNRNDKQVRDCIREHKEILNQINALRTSVLLNHKLVDSSIDLQSVG